MLRSPAPLDFKSERFIYLFFLLLLCLIMVYGVIRAKLVIGVFAVPPVTFIII